MSGGVDSSVAAALLVEQGYDVVGATMKLFCYGDSVPDRPCCSLDSITDARLVAHKLGIPHYVLNFEDRFGRDVIANFVAEYASGRTPIPCVRCNSFTKFRDFLYHADALDCAYVATGHYAIARDGALFRGRDPRKDQSYFLWGIDRSVVARMLTPVGDLTKRETRAVARSLGLVTAEKVESVEICFVPDDDYVGVLGRHLPAAAPALTPGPLVTAGGAVVGEHAGFARYTIGQRRGLPGGFREPMYVVAIRPETREVVIGSGDELFGHSVTLAELNWLADALAPGDAVLVQCRHRAARCRLRRQPAPTEETGRPARDRRQRPGAGYELHLRAVPELLVRHDVCADCREPHGGPAAAAARRAAHARDPPRSLARREPARRHGAARCARAIERLGVNAAIGETGGRASFDIRFDVNAAPAHVRLRMTLTAPGQTTLRLAINFRLQFGSEVVTVTGTQTLDLTTLSESATLTVLVDGGIYATITETDGSNTFAGGGGQELTADDLTALRAIFDAIATTVQQFDALFAPAASLGA